MARLKIAILIDQLLPGGVQKAAVNETIQLKRLGYCTTLLVLSRSGKSQSQKYLAGQIQIRYISQQRSFNLPFFRFLSTSHLFSPVIAPLRIKKSQYDLIISHGTTTSITAFTLKLFKEIPYVIVLHDPLAYILQKIYLKKLSGIPARLMKYSLKVIEGIIVRNALSCWLDSHVHERVIQNNYNVKPKVIYLGINTSRMSNAPLGDSIISFGRWDLGKNPELLLEIIAKIPESQLIMAGSWTKKHELKIFKNFVKQKNLQKRISIITGYKDYQLRRICAQGRLWVHPHFEAFSVSALEAAGYGLPIVIPDKSGVTELFTNKIHGFFPKKTTAEEFVKTIRPLLKNKALSQKMGVAAAAVAKNYSWQRRALEIERKIKSLLHRPDVTFIMNATVSTKSTGGGEHFAMELLKRAPQGLKIQIITTSAGFFHLKRFTRERKLNLNFMVLAKSPLDNLESPVAVAAAYTLRSVQTTIALIRLKPRMVTGASDLMPDVLPVAIYKFIRRSIFWSSRLFHLIEAPLNRKGNPLVNTMSYLLQKMSIIFLKSADLVIVDNVRLKKQLIKLGIKKERLAIHFGGVDTKIMEIKPVASLSSDAVFVGRLLPHKGIFEAIETWQKVTQAYPDAKLNIIGHGTREITDEIKKRIKNYNLEGNINLLGYIHEKDKIYAYLKSSKMLLFLDHEAGFGLVVLEAMAAGIGVICYNLPIFGHVYEKGFIKAPIRDIDQVAANITLLLSNPALRMKLGRDAQAQAQKFSWERAAERFWSHITST